MQETPCREIIRLLMQTPNPVKDDVNRIKLEVCRGYKKSMPANSELIKCLTPTERTKLLPILRRKNVRTISGVAVVAVMTKPYPCPKERPCVYCPGGPPYGVPQSYTGREPAAMRGLQHRFDPFQQVRARIEQLQSIGHVVDKVELIVMGGTFPAMPTDYQETFVKRCSDAMTGVESEDLGEAKKNAETSQVRNVGITVETRPDYAKESHVDHILGMGVTRVELGVQTLYDDIYEIVDRGHTVSDVVEAFQIAKDSGLKVTAHVMPGLAGSDYERDLETFRMLFQDARFKPDGLKIYPTLVLRGTKLYEWWKRGEYNPYTTEKVVDLIAEAKKMLPKWIRIQRVQRDIPSNLIVAGVKESNLRQLVLEKLRREGFRCRCIRCREVGHAKQKLGLVPKPENIEFVIEKYQASGGEELFLSYEDVEQGILIGLLRLRLPSEKVHRPEIRRSRSMMIRELHVYGPVVPLHTKVKDGWQHRGYGKLLLRNAERIAREEYDAEKIVVTSGLGVKEYYFRQGYVRDGPYVSKLLS